MLGSLLIQFISFISPDEFTDEEEVQSFGYKRFGK